MKTVLDTNRLLLREFTLEDTLFIVQLLNTPGWLQFIGDRNVKNEAQAIAYLENGPLKSYRDNGYGLYAVIRKQDNLCIGMCGILRRDTLEYPDIGFAFLPEYMGKGYAFEAASVTLEYAQQLQLPTICAITHPANNASIKLLEKIGLSFINSIRYPQTDETLLLYITS